MQLRHTKIIASSNNNDVIVTQYWNNSFSVSYCQALRSTYGFYDARRCKCGSVIKVYEPLARNRRRCKKS